MSAAIKVAKKGGVRHVPHTHAGKTAITSRGSFHVVVRIREQEPRVQGTQTLFEPLTLPGKPFSSILGPASIAICSLTPLSDLKGLHGHSSQPSQATPRLMLLMLP